MGVATYFLLVVFGSTVYNASGQNKNYTGIRRVFTDQILRQLGNGTAITTEDVTLFFSNHMLQLPAADSLPNCSVDDFAGITANQESCLLQQCLSPVDISDLSGLSTEDTTPSDVCTLALILLHTLENKTCASEKDPTASGHKHPKISTAATWGYSLLCTTVIVLAALGGLLALPFVRGVNYKRLLLYMVGLAVGTLAGSSLLFLLPEALELPEQELDVHSHVWKSLVVIGAIYVFFIVERVLKIVTGWKERNKRERDLHNSIQSGRFAKQKPESKYGGPKFTELDTPPQLSSVDSGTGTSVTKGSDLSNVAETESVNGSVTKDRSKETLGPEGKHEHVAPVAWMIIFGDALHNFVDGVSIGAAFTDSVLGGVSVSVAILCEELPHELGDFAVLLNGGMSKKRAALFNFLSACTIYVGMIVGIFLGENVEAHTWVFAFAGGMFLYIALVDMMPAMCAAGESEENKKQIGTGWIFLIQNLGILSGFGAMLVLAIYGGKLESAITGEA